MKDMMTKRPMLAFIVVSVIATLVSAWLLNPTLGPVALFTNASAAALALKAVTALLILGAGASLTFIAMRLATDPRALGLVPAGAGYTSGRRLSIHAASGPVMRTADQARYQGS